MRLFRILFLFLFSLVACSGNRLTPEDGLPLFRDDLDRESLHRAIYRSLEYLQRLPPDRVIGEWPRKLTAQEVKESLLAFTEHLDLLDDPASLFEALRSRFDLYESVSDQGHENNLFTGYYQPIIEASLIETPTYRFPIYRRPDDLVEIDPTPFAPRLQGEKVVGRVDGNRLVPYFSRKEIDSLAQLKGKGYEIAWAKDPVQLFFLHIQGSGILRLEDGRLLPINYHASNGRPYTSIGKFLIGSGKVSEQDLSMQSLQRYLKEHPDERDAIFAQNESYVFFRFVEVGPLGSLEVPLTPGRSIATDARIFPKGALALIVSQKPVFDAAGNVSWQPFSRFVVNQDTGSAIRGPGRVDLYFGTGEQAGISAGVMKSSGRLFFLIKKTDHSQLQP